MFRTFATGLYPRFAQKRLGAKPVSPIDTMLVTTGIALAVRRDKPLLGIALLALGSYRVWKAAAKSSQRCGAP
ncbi:MAG: hypothetical protein EOP61_33275 [Sphingomonadales bacterium]|nr:MAG: hypothetical protein EOP61_33275 [Sphingomonadales bacterium]